MKLTIAIAQMKISFGQPAENFSRIESFVAKAAQANADIIVFPEMWNTGYDLTRLNDIADVNGEQTKHVLSALSKKYHLMIHGGSVATQRDQQFYNTTYVTDEAGQLICNYDKVHLFGLMREDDFLAAGDQKSRFEVKGVPATSVICYDIRFPEWLRTLSLTDSRIIFVPAEWPSPRIAQWRKLLAARAIENQSFVVAVNRVGSDPDNHFGGNSVVIDPLGNEVLRLDSREELQTVTIDTDETDHVRGFMPVFEDRRPELYE
ncbi:hydrolase, carbon-nitrogen family [Secundilactobacillus odoratitofui DSM 19909 = JCM 15043]|uniref:Hydrolase, carbon-nitrogen family n=1 Tax=Secundilactobacillus odoratitofui DSM 19909 = JCM 15043 TaxID=1423776 RepID=A0A0R1M1F1_9LACO|nr:carbon-nitrogen family hydrolase [Secundilactobacillus odoratitofui]KRK99009.1 hydrolase, carbon-nitrogen family [Secundilactobacillus odoratitofui DSM 19909 = JCM 15043]